MKTVSLALRPARPNWRPTASCWAIRSSRSLRALLAPPHASGGPTCELDVVRALSVWSLLPVADGAGELL